MAYDRDRFNALLARQSPAATMQTDIWGPAWGQPFWNTYSESDDIASAQKDIDERKMQANARGLRLQARMSKTGGWGNATGEMKAAQDEILQADADRAALDVHTAKMLRTLPEVRTGTFLMGPKAVNENTERINLSNLLHGGQPQVPRGNIPLASWDQPQEKSQPENYGGEAMPQTPYGALKQTGGMGTMGETTRDAAARMEMARMREMEANATAAELGARNLDPEAKMNDELFNLNTGRTAAVARGRAGAEAAGGLVKGQGEAATFFDPQVSMQRLRTQEAANEAVVNRYQMPAQQASEGRAQVEGLRNEGALARTQLTTNTNQLIALVREYSRQAANVSLTEEQRQMNAQAATAIAQVLKGYGIDLGTGIR